MSETFNSLNPGDFVKAYGLAGIVHCVYLNHAVVVFKTYNGIKPCLENANLRDVTKISRKELEEWKKIKKTSYPIIPPEEEPKWIVNAARAIIDDCIKCRENVKKSEPYYSSSIKRVADIIAQHLK